MAELSRAQARGAVPRPRRGRVVEEMPRGGWREGAGRKNLYPGKDVRLTVAVTTQAADRAHDLRDRLQAQYPDVTVSVSDAVEYALEIAWAQRVERLGRKRR